MLLLEVGTWVSGQPEWTLGSFIPGCACGSTGSRTEAVQGCCQHQSFCQDIPEHWGTVLSPNQLITLSFFTARADTITWHSSLGKQVSQKRKMIPSSNVILFTGAAGSPFCTAAPWQPSPLAVMSSLLRVRQNVKAASTPVHTQPLHTPQAFQAAASFLPKTGTAICVSQVSIFTLWESPACWGAIVGSPDLSHSCPGCSFHLCACVFTYPKGQAARGTWGIFLWVPQVSPL